MIYTSPIARKVAKYLLDIKAILINPNNLFTWSSGIKSPIYCDNRISLAYPEVRRYIKDSFTQLAKDKFNDATLVAGVATAGIAHGVLLAESLGLPFCYVRSKPKNHGTKSFIEGRITKQDKVIVVEDLFSTGGSTIKAINALNQAEVDVLGAVAIFNYGFDKVDEAFAAIDTPFYTLSNFAHLLDVLKENNRFSEQELSFMRIWYTTMK